MVLNRRIARVVVPIAILVATSCRGGGPKGAEAEAAVFADMLQGLGEKMETLPKGTAIKIRLEQPIASASTEAGDRFEATLAAPLSIKGKLLARAGAPVWGELIAVDRGHELTMTLRGVEVNGIGYDVRTLSLNGDQMRFGPGSILRFVLEASLELPVQGET